MQTTLSSEDISVTITERGAEMTTLRGADGVDYLWGADKAIWSRHAPVLFPIVGRLKGDAFIHRGQSYSLAQHGFARDCMFDRLDPVSDSSAGFALRSNRSTKALYPFDFVLTTYYEVHADTVRIQHTVENSGQGSMFFSIGAHPGFSCAWPESAEPGDYYIEFESVETARVRLLERGLLTTETRAALNESNILPLGADTFDRDALVFNDLKPQRVSLCCHGSTRRVTIDARGYPFLGIWSKPSAPFVCIEPWFGHADSQDVSGELSKKPGIISLPAGQGFRCEYAITITPPADTGR